MRSYKTKRAIAGAALIAQLFTTTPVFANNTNVNSNANKNQKTIIEKTDLEELQKSLDEKDYVSFQRKYDELIKRGLIEGEPIVNYAPVLGPRTRLALINLRKQGYNISEERREIVEPSPVQEKSIPVEKETTDLSSTEGFKDEMKRTPYNSWDEKKQLEKALTVFERRVEYIKLLYHGDVEYPFSHYVGERWLKEFNKSLNQFEAQYSRTLKYADSKQKMEDIIKKHFPQYESYDRCLGAFIVIRNNARYVINEIKLMNEKLRKVAPVQMNDVVKDTKREISNRLEGPLNRYLILDSNKMPFLYDYALENNLSHNYLDVLEHMTKDETFVSHKKWLTESFFGVANFNNYNKDEVIFAYNELSIGTQYALSKHYIEKHGKDNIPNNEKFALQVFGLNVQGYESASSFVQYLDRMDRFDSRTQLEIYRRAGAGTSFAESESDWINLKMYIYTDFNEALNNVLRTDIILIRDQTKDRYELKSASIKTPGSDIREDARSTGRAGAHLQEAFTMVEQGTIDSTINIQSGGVRVSGAPHLHGDRLENLKPKTHNRNVDDMFGRNRVETTVPTRSVSIVRSVADLGVFNYRYVQKGMFTNLNSRVEEDFNYTRTTNLSETDSSESSKVDVNYTNTLKGHLKADGPSRVTRNEFSWNRNKTTSNVIYETENQKNSNDFESVRDTFTFESYNRNVFSNNYFNISLFDVEGRVTVGESPNTLVSEKTEIKPQQNEEGDESYSITKTEDLKGYYEYYLDSKLLNGWYESYSRGNFGDEGVYNEIKSFKDPVTGENTINKEGTSLDTFKEWDFEHILHSKEWKLHAGTQQLNPYTNSLFFTPSYKGVFTLRPENSYYVKFGSFEKLELNDNLNRMEYKTHKFHDYFKSGEPIPEHLRSDRNVFDSTISYHGAGAVLGVPLLENHEIGFGYVHNQTLMNQNKHLGLLSYSWREDSIAAIAFYQGAFNLNRNYNDLFRSITSPMNRNDAFNYRFPRDSKSIEQLYVENDDAFFVEGTLLNKDNLNAKAFVGSGEGYERFQAGAVSNYVHDLFNLKVGGDYDKGNEEHNTSGGGGFYLSNKMETAYILGSLIGEKEFGWRTDEALRYLGEIFNLKVEMKAYGSFSENKSQNKKGRFIGSELDFENGKVVLYYFGGKDVYSENVEDHKEFNLMGGVVRFTPNLSIESYGTWKGDLGNGAFIHPIYTRDNKFGITGLLGLTKDRVNYDLLNEKIEDYYLTAGISLGFRNKGLSLLLMPISYTNNFNYKHIIETGLSGTYWLPGGSLGFGTGYIQNVIQNKSNDLKNPFNLPYKNNDFNSRVFYVYGEGSGRGILGFDYTTLRLTGKFFGENELYKLNQLITSFELSDFWKRVYLDLYFNHKVDKGNLILSDEIRRLDNLIEKYEVKGVLGVEFYF